MVILLNLSWNIRVVRKPNCVKVEHEEVNFEIIVVLEYLQTANHYGVRDWSFKL